MWSHQVDLGSKISIPALHGKVVRVILLVIAEVLALILGKLLIVVLFCFLAVIIKGFMDMWKHFILIDNSLLG